MGEMEVAWTLSKGNKKLLNGAWVGKQKASLSNLYDILSSPFEELL